MLAEEFWPQLRIVEHDREKLITWSRKVKTVDSHCKENVTKLKSNLKAPDLS